VNSLVFIVFVAVFAVAGSVMLFFPDRLQQRALRENVSKKDWPLLGYFWYEAIRKPSYLVGMRFMGAAFLVVALLLFLIIISAAARGAMG
jgi:protein-S-isoprenylcysteine O-methyltransferase Ste14